MRRTRQSLIKTYEQLVTLLSFIDRFEYLKIGGVVGRATFGFERYLNQSLYRSQEWKTVRRDAIIRDNGRDLGIKDREIVGRLLVHHINPITINNVLNHDDCVFDLNNLICSSLDTHNAIHFGDNSLISTLPIERKEGDTTLWKIVY